jgi:hypothetical protein
VPALKSGKPATELHGEPASEFKRLGHALKFEANPEPTEIDRLTGGRLGRRDLCVPASSGSKPPSMSGALDMDPPQILDAALLYAARGWPVFPCHRQTKRPLLKPDIDRATGAEIPNAGGLKKASTDPEPIRGWWKRWPKAMIGVPTGSPIGAFVVNFDAGIDEKTGQVFEVSKLIRALCLELDAALPETWTAETPRGGRHLYFKLPKGSPPGNRAGLIGRVDVRGDGGYVIVPPSVRSDGKSYRWITAPW